MIIDDPQYRWIYVVPTKPAGHVPIRDGRRITKEEYLEHWGKWVIVDSRQRLDELALDLEPAVELRIIHMIKYLRSAWPGFGFDKPIMGIFCDDRDHEEVLQVLSMVGVTPHRWLYERDMWEKWGPGGEWLEKYIAGLGLSAEEAEEFRQESRRQDEAWLEYQYVRGERFGRLREDVHIGSLEDIDLLPTEGELRMMTPLVAIVGRPNVGKSTLFNQLLGRQQTITDDSSGTTRDRVHADVSCGERNFTLIDTGGFDLRPNSELEQKVKEQVESGIGEADAIILVVDGQEGVTRTDQEMAQMLLRSEKPLILAVNKIDLGERDPHEALAFLRLDLGKPLLISARHNIGLAELKNELVARFPPSFRHLDKSSMMKLAIVGRPNVGKSMLLNALLGQERAVVEQIPGTTRDATDTVFYYVDNEPVLLIDTAGLRHPGEMRTDVQCDAVSQTRRAIDRADIVLLLLDAVELVTAQDIRIATYLREASKAILVVVNKWDLAKDPSQEAMECVRKEIGEEFEFLPDVPTLFISAKFRQGTENIVPTAREICREATRQIHTPLFAG